MTKEKWKSIVGYEGLYEISNYGNVRSLDRFVACCYGSKQFIRGKIISPQPNQHGYLMVSLNKESQRNVHYIHRLVAQAFIPNPNNLPQVNHKDEVKDNNMVDNLEWCDNIYNINYGSARDKIRNFRINTGKPICQIDKVSGEVIATFINSSRAMEETGIDASAINKCCLNRPKFKTAGGFIWKYAE